MDNPMAGTTSTALERRTTALEAGQPLPSLGEWLDPPPGAGGLWRSIRAGPGFALALDGAAAVADFNVANATYREEPGRYTAELTLNNPAVPLVILLTLTHYEDPLALEVTTALRNDGDVGSAVVSEWFATDLVMSVAPTIVGCKGGTTEFFYPPRAFTRFELTPMQSDDDWGTAEGWAPTLTSGGGRSSGADLPFFLLHDRSSESGIFAAVGWSGAWRTRLVHLADGTRLYAGIPDLNFRVPPGETVVGPTVLLGPYAGDIDAGGNALRRFLYSQAIPTIAGKRVLPPVYYDHWFSLGVHINEEVLLKQSSFAAAIGCEYFVVNAGWYAGCGDAKHGFGDGVGNFETVDNVKFPRGLAPLVKQVEAKRMQFGLWFEPERAHQSSKVAQDHPDWMLKNTHRPESPFLLVNLGLPSVQEWVVGLMSGFIEQVGVRWLMWDMNAEPLEYFPFLDEDDTVGLAQIRYVNGLYKIYDELRSKHPDVLFEGCASGGRRIDLALLKRVHTNFSSDQTEYANLVRHHLSGGNRFLPGVTMNTSVYQRERDGKYPPFRYHSSFGGTLGFMDQVARWDDEAMENASRHVRVYKEVRKYLVHDFYPLFPQPISLDAWDGWQFHDPTSDAGFLLVFRLRSGRAMQEIQLRGLDPGKQYVLSDPYAVADRQKLTGSELLSGLAVSLDEEATYLRVYTSS